KGLSAHSAGLQGHVYRDGLHAAAAVSGMVRSIAAWVWFAVLPGLVLALTDSSSAQPADTILLNGKFVIYGSAPPDAVAIADDKIAAIGTSADVRRLAGAATRVIDLGGRTVIPGLIDSHIHAIRAGLTYTTEVQWSGVRSLAEAIGRIRDKARATPK